MRVLTQAESYDFDISKRNVPSKKKFLEIVSLLNDTPIDVFLYLRQRGRKVENQEYELIPDKVSLNDEKRHVVFHYHRLWIADGNNKYVVDLMFDPMIQQYYAGHTRWLSNFEITVHSYAWDNDTDDGLETEPSFCSYLHNKNAFINVMRR